MWKRLQLCPLARTRRCIVYLTFVEGLIDTPYILMFLLSHICPWRLPSLYRRVLSTTKDPNIRRQITWNTFNSCLLDFPHFVLFLLCHIFPWRLRFMWTSCLENPHADHRHAIVRLTFIQGINDFPFVLCFLMSLCMVWRAKKAYKSVITIDVSDECRRQNALKVLFLALKDIPCGFMAAFLFVTQWRWYRFQMTTEEWHCAAFNQFTLLLVPNEFICIFIAPLSLWRFPSMLRCLSNSQRVRNDQDRRMVGIP